MFDQLSPEQLAEFTKLAIDFGKNAIVGILILIIGYWFAGKVKGWILKGTTEKLGVELATFFGSLARYTVIAATFIAALGRIGIETTSVMAIFASAGLAVGLALQGSLANFAAGVMILFFKPFRVGDIITASGHTGGVVQIGLFSTILHTPDNQKIIVPNSGVTGGSIVNLTTLETRRNFVDFGVAYGSDLNKVEELVLGAMKGCETVSKEHDLAVIFTEMAGSSLNFKAAFWCTAANYVPSGPEVRRAVYDALTDAGVDIPFDQIVVHNA